MWEFNRDYERFGTTRTLENIPVFGGQPTMEGLLIESSMNAPFHFINQKETSETATEAVPGVPYERPASTSRPAWPTCGCTASATTSPTTPARTTRTSGWPAATSACRTRRCRRRPRPACRWSSAAAASPSTRSAAATWSRCPVQAGAGRPPRLAGQRAHLVRPPGLAGDPAGVRVLRRQGGQGRLRRRGALPLTSLPREPLARPGELAATTSRTGDVISFRTDRSASPTSSRSPGSPTGRSRARRARGCCRPG